jgi:hypothetical protein
MTERAFAMIELQELNQRWIDCARTLETLIQHLGEAKEMEVIRQDPILVQELTGQWWLCKAYRCMYLAHIYSEAMSMMEAQALLSRSMEELYLAQSCMKDGSASKDLARWDVLKQKLSCKQAVFRASQYVDKEQLQIWQRSTNLSNIHLIDLPPTFESIPCKPFFFDISGMDIQPPSFSHYYEKSKKGLGGFFTNIWKRA